MEQTLDQKRARHAWEQVEKLRSSNKGFDDIKTHFKKMTTRILNSGLGPTLAFMRAKKEALPMVDAVESWINKRMPPGNGESKDLFERIINSDSEFLRRATDEVMEYLQWYVRFVEPYAKEK